jgi:predicted RNA methylase
MRKLFGLPLLALAAVLVLAGPLLAQKTKTAIKKPDSPFLPSPQVVVDKMLELAEVKPGEVVYDLGCGKGIIVVSAAKMGANAIGLELDPRLVRDTQANIDRNKVGDRAKVFQRDIFAEDLSGANVIALYVLPEMLVRLIPQLEKLQPGSRIVSHEFAIKGIKPAKVVKMQGPIREHYIFLYRAPLEKEDQ